MDHLEEASWLVLTAVLTEVAWFGLGMDVRDLAGPFLVAGLMGAAFHLTGVGIAKSVKRPPHTGAGWGLSAYVFVAVIQLHFLMALVRQGDWNRVIAFGPAFPESYPGLVIAGVLWPFQWMAIAACFLGMDCSSQGGAFHF